ncbi:ImmA/IrrE family metallo-endopeptidase [Staphylococcus chromogenes]|uniref:ImmA/IrrE family metallo-endopeptidase n=1 Tax=Staphylococcus chromogenes TaxID=46126 RepID=UPI000D1B26F7|nr:ImmA/IrrE family metallo-endopeptidase [Staphylococcus chromogenes]MDT0739770.1 ImmA/IrrE family metallo-endopeptidase [Staphylococcus chromogenes]PTG32042.1 toxin [Staphylococcus chromogenes]RIM31721.1 ImmA/IrrE family metallo-endopeptidase [Staphylococcus chromogenes]
MAKYEDLMIQNSHIPISDEYSLKRNFKGIYADGVILIDKNLSNAEKHEVIAEELAHYKYTYGNILDQSQFNNRKFENYARRYSYEATMPLSGIVKAFKQGVHNLYELANFFEVTEDFAQECIEHYKMKYGIGTHCGKYFITFEPLRVFEIKNIN